MNEPAFTVLTTSHFDRLLKKLAPKHPELVERLEEAIAILSLDPYNKSRKYAIRSGRFRFRYDVAEREVVLLYCGVRREDTY